MGQGMIRVENFSFIYENSQDYALKQISFEIQEGEFVGIIGSNRAGKSTLCQALVGVVPHVLGGQWDGEIRIGDICLSETQGEGATSVIGIVFQDAESQFTQETVEDEIAFAMCNFGYPRELMEKRIREAALSCGLMELLDRSPFQLSGGQQQRLAVACVLALSPKVIILDEATSQLDPVGRDEVFSLVKKLHDKGTTVIMVDHNIEKIAEYASKVLVMYQGELKMFADCKTVFGQKEKLAQYCLRIPQVTDAALAFPQILKEGQPPVLLNEAHDLFEPWIRKEVSHE